MNLFKINLKAITQSIFINNVDIIKFLNFFKAGSAVKVTALYGSSRDEYYYTNHAGYVTTIEELIDFFQTRIRVHFNSLEFQCGNYPIESNDLYKYAIYSDESYLRVILPKMILYFFNISDIQTIEEIKAQ